MQSELRVGILGAGIMGCSLALFLARRGVRVTLIDAASAPFTRASRWNEGKIHLGFLYAGDPSLATARKMVPGGLAFRPIVEELIGRSIDAGDLAYRRHLSDPSQLDRHRRRNGGVLRHGR